MSEKQKQILNTFEQVLPEMSKEDQSYLLGFGEGIAAGMKRGGKQNERDNDSGDRTPG